jgi:predicted alpha/beta superfamily hydrolase
MEHSGCLELGNSVKTEKHNVTEEQERDSHITGSVARYASFQSKFVEPRNLDIWLPPSYGESTGKRYPALYMHDGQSLFEPGHAFTAEEWEVDEMMTKLIKENRIREAIVVGIWNTGKRFREYQPGKPFQNLSSGETRVREHLDETYGGGALGDEYLQFIVGELKPFVDDSFRTLPDKENTFMMGSSMGGIITIYAIAEYPHVFGSVACLSTHYPVILGDNLDVPPILLRYLKSHLPRAGGHRIYFDYGTETHDAWYEPHQAQMDAVLAELGYSQGADWVTRRFEGAEHAESAWKQRLHIPLTFLLG